MNWLFVDVETTGLTDNSAIIEIALIPVIDGEIKPHFHSYVKPHEGASISLEALQVNKIDPKALETFPEPKEVIQKIITFIDSHECMFSLAGHNTAFDKKFLYRFFCRQGEYSAYLTRIRPTHKCTMELARAVFKHARKKPEGFSLGKLCKYFGIPLENAHTAHADIAATVQLYQALTAMMPEVEEVQSMTYEQKKRKFLDRSYIQINEHGDIYIDGRATKNKEALKFILGEIWELYAE